MRNHTTMETALDLSRWRAAPRGVAYRRWTIISSGLRQLLHTKFFIGLLFVAWTASILIAALGFLFSQSIGSGGWLDDLAANFSPRAQATVTAIGGLIVLYPDICIGGLFTVIFWLHSFLALGLSLVGLTVMVPRLIARDRASNALTIYLSRPLTSTDYLLGKLGMIVSLLLLLWTGPLVFGWLLSLALAPDRDFIVYSFTPLLHALEFNAIALVVLSALALGVSALNRSSRPTIILWIVLWIVAGTMAKFPRAPDWLRRASFTHDLSEVRQTVFKLDLALSDAGTRLPLINQNLAESLTRQGASATPHDFQGALIALAVFIVLSSAVFLRRLRPE
jgi:ABC-2 type transport system permease protein